MLRHGPLLALVCIADGYSVKDISYVWKDGPVKSVGIRPDVQLPQFKVRGHRLKTKMEELTTGWTLTLIIVLCGMLYLYNQSKMQGDFTFLKPKNSWQNIKNDLKKDE